jgi:hypothetical protein
MAQTPISASVNFGSTTPTTIYTVPVGATAVVKSVIPTSVITQPANVTLNKVSSSGTVYPLALAAETAFLGSAPYLNPVYNLNLLPGPITLSAGESISISTSTATNFKDPISVSNTNFKLCNGNYVNGNYVVLGQDTSTGYGLVLTSTDGITWTQRTFNFYVVTQDITFGNGYYVVCNQSSSGKIHYSTDLVTWTEVSLPTAIGMYSIEFGNNKFVVGGSGGYAFTATSTPVTWTAITFQNGGTSYDINSVDYIGTNYTFGTGGPLFTSTDLTTFTSPSYVYDLNGISANRCTASATRFFQSTSNDVESAPTRVLQYTTDGVTWTNATLSGTNGTPYASPYPIAFGNGALILMQSYWPSTALKYSRSADNGNTWTNVTGFTPTNYLNSSTSYAQGVYPIIDATRSYVAFNILDYLQMNAVDATGVVTAAASFNFNQTNYTSPFAWAGNPTTGTWIAATGGYYTGNSQYWGWYYGTGPTNGAVGQSTNAIVYIPTYGNCTTTLYRPGANGFFFGTSNGYIAFNTSQSATSFSWVRPTAINSAIVSIAADGNTSTSRIVYIQNNGYGAVSQNQGGDWTTMRLPGTGFARQTDEAGRCLQYVNGVWIATNNVGQSFYSSNGLTWSTAPIDVQNIATVNSNNVFLSSTGVFVSSGSSVTSFTRTTSANYSSYPSNRNIVYVGSKYLIGQANTLVQSTDLITWTSASVSSTQINNVVYYTTANATVLVADGTGNVMAVGAKRSSPTAEGKVGKPITISNALVVGNATAGIIEIT